MKNITTIDGTTNKPTKVFLQTRLNTLLQRMVCVSAISVLFLAPNKINAQDELIYLMPNHPFLYEYNMMDPGPWNYDKWDLMKIFVEKGPRNNHWVIDSVFRNPGVTFSLYNNPEYNKYDSLKAFSGSGAFYSQSYWSYNPFGRIDSSLVSKNTSNTNLYNKFLYKYNNNKLLSIEYQYRPNSIDSLSDMLKIFHYMGNLLDSTQTYSLDGNIWGSAIYYWNNSVLDSIVSKNKHWGVYETDRKYFKYNTQGNMTKDSMYLYTGTSKVSSFIYDTQGRLDSSYWGYYDSTYFVSRSQLKLFYNPDDNYDSLQTWKKTTSSTGLNLGYKFFYKISAFSIEDNSNQKLNVYPNPVSAWQVLKLETSITGDINVRFLNMNGVELVHKKLNGANKEILIPDHSPPGLYLLIITSESKLPFIKKILVD